MANVQIGTTGIKKALSKYDPLKAITEYIWNGFDAQAKNVTIEFIYNEMGIITSIVISDDGYGIEKDKLNEKFAPFLDSKKVYDPNNRNSDVHGKNGVGRLSFFKLCNYAQWDTIYSKNKGNYKYTIDISSQTLEDYNPSEIVKVSENTGTRVSLSEVGSILSVNDIKEYLLQEFSWYLKLNENNNKKIIFDGTCLDCSVLIEDTETIDFVIDGIEFKSVFVQWGRKLNEEYSCYYFIDSSDKEIGKRTTLLNNKGDNFHHSVYVTSKLFDSFEFDDSQIDGQLALSFIPKNQKSKEYKIMKNKIDSFLRRKRKAFIEVHAAEIVEKMEIEKAFPNFNCNNIFDTYKKTQIEGVVKSIYTVKPNMFTGLNIDQKKTLIRLLDLTMQTNEVDSLITILEEIINMDSEEREDLSQMLQYTKMSNITKTMKLIKDRYKAVEELKNLVFNKELHADEVHHLQLFIEKHYWLFGEQYNLMTAAEPKFEEALRRYLSFLHKEYDDVSITHPDKLREMDIFTVRKNYDGTVSNIIVELKHPSVRIGETQLSQVKRYKDVIFNQADFNDSSSIWRFYLIGNRFTSNGYIEGEIENCKNHGEKSLVYKVNNFSIYVKTWSEIFNEFELRHSWLNKKLELERERLVNDETSADEIVKNQDENTAIQPAEYKMIINNGVKID